MLSMEHSRWNISTHVTPPPAELDDGTWHAVDDSENETGRIFVRVAEATDGRLIIVGLHLSGEHEITANTLRAIQPAAILRTIAWRENNDAPPRSDGDIGPAGLARFEGVADEIAAISDTAPPTEQQSKRGRRGPSSDELARFADIYRRHLRENPYNAMDRTARELNIHRATAHRWHERCRDQGLLDPKEDNQ